MSKSKARELKLKTKLKKKKISPKTLGMCLQKKKGMKERKKEKLPNSTLSDNTTNFDNELLGRNVRVS